MCSWRLMISAGVVRSTGAVEEQCSKSEAEEWVDPLGGLEYE